MYCKIIIIINKRTSEKLKCTSELPRYKNYAIHNCISDEQEKSKGYRCY